MKKKNSLLAQALSNFSLVNYLTLPPKMTSEMVESAWANIGFFFHHLDPEIPRIVRRLEHLHVKIIKERQSVLFNRTSLSIYIYIYKKEEIFMCVCVLEFNTQKSLQIAKNLDTKMQGNS